MHGKRVLMRMSTIFLCAGLVAGISGCGGGGNGPGSPPPGSNPVEFAYAVNLATGASDIYGAKIDLATGELTPIGSGFGGVTSPSSIAIERSAKFAYVTNFTEETISAFAINPTTGVLTAVPGSPFPAPGNPVMIAVEPTGKYVYTSNQGGANVSGFAINSSTGAVTPLHGSPYPSGPAPVAIIVDPTGKFVFVANSAGSTISGFSINAATGDLTPVPGSPFPADFFPRAFVIDPASKFLYAGIASSFMGDSTEIMAFSIGPTGTLTTVPGSPFSAGRTSIALSIDHSGKYFYAGSAQDSTLFPFAIDPATGALSPMAGGPIGLGGWAGNSTVDASGKFLYLGGGGVSGFVIDAATGGLTPVPGSPYPVPDNISAVATVKTR